MSFKNIRFEVRGVVGLVYVNRPDVMNALNMETIEELELAIRKADDDSATRAIILTGSGDKAFVAGADIAAMKAMSHSESAEFAEKGHRLMDTIERASKPVIACVNGFALGGGTEIAISCDIILASEKAKFGLPEVKLGLYPGFGGTQRLARIVGPMRARELIFTGKIIDANEAYSMGLVNHIYPADKLMDEAIKLANVIAENGPIAISLAKKMVNEGFRSTLTEGLENERENFSKLFQTKDRTEGLSAFLEKRKPVFNGR